MARTSTQKKAAVSKAQEQAGDAAVNIVDALASRLAQLGRRKWKVAELESALDKAASSLEDDSVKSHIQANLQQCAAALHERLLALQAEQGEGEAAAAAAEKPAKRAKRSSKQAAAAAAAGEQAPAAPAAALEAPAPSLALGSGYLGLVEAAAAAAGLPAGTAAPSTAALLLARKLPSTEAILAHVRQVQPQQQEQEQEEQRAEALVAAARAALGICSTLSCEAGSPEDALRMFAPAVRQLEDACQLAQQHAQQAQLQELRQLAGRCLASMHAALLQQRQQLLGGSGGSSSSGTDCFWRTHPQQVPAAAAARAACAAAAAICSLCTTLRLSSSSSSSGSTLLRRHQLQALAVDAAADLRLLSPYALSGQLAYLAALPLDQVCGGDAEARRYLALYGGAAKLDVSGEQDYLTRLAAARKAAAAADSLGEAALAASITAAASSLPASQDFVGWLQEQPPSGIVTAALAAARSGLTTLSSHLVSECSERGLQALVAAMLRGGGSAGAGTGGAAAGEAAGAAGAGGHEAAEGGGDAALDDLLFFDDKEGDATMFGRKWNTGSDDDEEDESDDDEEDESEGEEEGGRQGGRGRGLRLGRLPE